MINLNTNAAPICKGTPRFEHQQPRGPVYPPSHFQAINVMYGTHRSIALRNSTYAWEIWSGKDKLASGDGSTDEAANGFSHGRANYRAIY